MALELKINFDTYRNQADRLTTRVAYPEQDLKAQCHLMDFDKYDEWALPPFENQIPDSWDKPYNLIDWDHELSKEKKSIRPNKIAE